ncbi:hypothetical protein [Noviherbaspirillum galbum]|uniref:Uncharacterized protein n=1 Tax=Noviherbaspirillum galbum TaxID=2709383 RepID=A0A6B3STK7_9BURK|nr:hypothetical protein [Noviherbaspirillum galbum]NEX61732.1 hypothetical protein [Noviherbaspirillum galbum]
MIEQKNGFTFVEGQRVFSVTPDEIRWRMRETWLDDIRNGHNIMVDVILPYLEREAVSRLSKENSVFKDGAPSIRDGYEDWRMWWLNEASQNCITHSPVGLAGEHLSPIGQTAVNIIMATSALREALSSSKAEEAAAISMLLICEAIAGGYSIEMESAKIFADAAKEAKKQAYESGAGKSHRDLQLARRAAVDYAKRAWVEKPDTRIGEMADQILERLKQNKHKLTSLESFPKPDTIKTWLREAGAAGTLAIPEAAQKRGRSKAN